MARRNSRLAFAGGAWVFPGGRVDRGDWDGEPVTDLRDRRMLDAARRAAVREAAGTGAVIEADSLVLISHWTPPIQAPKRFATYFFLGPAPAEIADLQADGGEIHELGWLRPAAAIDARNAREIELAPPQFITLEHLRPFVTAAEALAFYAARGAEHFATSFAGVEGGMVAMYEGDAAYGTDDVDVPAPDTGSGWSSPGGGTSAAGPTPERTHHGRARPPRGWQAPHVTEPATAPRPVGRPRDPHVDRAVREATGAMLAEIGYDGVTIEAVAQTAGVSKNAIYRRWPDKVSMVLDTLEQLAPAKDHSVDTGDIRADMATMLRAMAEALRGVDGRLATALASDITRHPELAEAFRARLVEPRREELEARVRRAVEAGQLPPDSDVELLTGIGPALCTTACSSTGWPPTTAT